MRCAGQIAFQKFFFAMQISFDGPAISKIWLTKYLLSDTIGDQSKKDKTMRSQGYIRGQFRAYLGNYNRKMDENLGSHVLYKWADKILFKSRSSLKIVTPKSGLLNQDSLSWLSYYIMYIYIYTELLFKTFFALLLMFC